MSNAPIAKIIPALTFVSKIDASKKIQTHLIEVGQLALFSISFTCNKSTTIKVFQHNAGKTTTPTAPTGTLVYEETVPANTVFYKRLTVKGNFVQYQLTNNEAQLSTIQLTTVGLTIPNFEAQTFLNSTIGINDNSSLSRNANDFTLDLIRGIHSDFSKVNILGITDQHQDETIGLNGMSYFPPSAETLYVVSTSNDDGIGGVGARDVIMEYLDENGVEQTYTIILQGTTRLNLAITGLAVNSLKVSNAGGQAANQGTISVFTNNTDVNVLCRILPQQSSCDEALSYKRHKY